MTESAWRKPVFDPSAPIYQAGASFKHKSLQTRNEPSNNGSMSYTSSGNSSLPVDNGSHPYFRRPFIRLAIGLSGVALSAALWSRVSATSSDASFLAALLLSLFVSVPLVSLSVGLPSGAIDGVIAKLAKNRDQTTNPI
jgi:hypothetical protein